VCTLRVLHYILLDEFITEKFSSKDSKLKSDFIHFMFLLMFSSIKIWCILRRKLAFKYLQDVLLNCFNTKKL